ncbi:5'-methylthioadenosine/S-adenosylhomocysteine nucleosidase [Fervidibacillus halotolerans]|uniref:5'-methylthioadenosine/S-adenosylhomocysteine nucleosidase n=1 Tax=Fervidibacillus halotolerans TaxID=2980027 RepID=A0A9E8RXA9_9BACI|nr:5'-methylthioadenosine/S-adenosylhomocysteine nucleosidase [Fervidibacillus halotolerans]WAA11536.1 5'-methylthioadenosine/S-adenosylhomocysteine nucleosidase [Fervidibacillus halotolerans]
MIGIIGAMEEEVKMIRDQMENRRMETIAHCQFTSGKLNGKDVVLLKSGIGKVNASMSTTILMERYNPTSIINTGSAGGLNRELDIGDIVISTEVRHHDVDVTAFGYEYGQVPQLPPAFVADKKLIEIAVHSAKEINRKTKTGLIVSGDSFMNDPNRVNTIVSHFEDVQAVEMEAAAIGQVCYQYEKPFVIIRSLSDIAGKESEISFDQFLEKAAVHSAQLVMSMVKMLNV